MDSDRRQLVATMPLHAITSTYGEQGLRARFAAEAETSRSSVSSVNLDEEAAKLIQYQQSYQAAGKLLQISQNVFDTLLQTVSR